MSGSEALVVFPRLNGFAIVPNSSWMRERTGAVFEGPAREILGEKTDDLGIRRATVSAAAILERCALRSSTACLARKIWIESGEEGD